jgi:tRNA_anti-like
MKRLLVVFILSSIALIQINCASNNNGLNSQSQSGKNSSDASPAIPITASELIEAYRMEGPDGAGKYKGKTLAVTGTVARSGKDYLNKLYVNLKSETNSVMEVHCTYNEDQKDAMSSLKEGQQVTIRGVCEGRLSTSVNLKDCVLQ